MSLSALTFFISSFIDDLVQLPITQPPLVNKQSHPAVLLQPPKSFPSLSGTSLWSYWSVFISSLFFLLYSFWTSQRSSSGSSSDFGGNLSECPMLVISCHIWCHRDKKKNSSNPRRSDPERLHPSLYDPKSRDAAQKPNWTLYWKQLTLHSSSITVSFSSHRSTLFNPPPRSLSPSFLFSHSPSSLLPLPRSLIHMLHQHSNDFIYSMKSFRGRIKRT